MLEYLLDGLQRLSWEGYGHAPFPGKNFMSILFPISKTNLSLLSKVIIKKKLAFLCIDCEPLPRNEWNLSKGSPRPELESYEETLSHWIWHLSQNMESPCWVSCCPLPNLRTLCLCHVTLVLTSHSHWIAWVNSKRMPTYAETGLSFANRKWDVKVVGFFSFGT